jgi:hypothetical protein
MQAPYYGSKNVSKMNTPAYIQLWNGTATAEPASKSAAIALFEGTTKSKAVYTPTSDGDWKTGEYITFSTPQNKYCFYHTSLPSPLLSDVDVYVAATPAAETKVGYIAAMLAACEKIEDIVFSSVAGVSWTLEALLNGATESVAEESTTGVAVSNTPGVGAWGKIGKLADDLSFEPTSTTTPTSEGDDIQTQVENTITFNLINVNARSWEIIDNDFNNKAVNVAFMDQTDDELPVVVINNFICTATFNPFGETKSIQIVLKKRTRKSSTYVKFWDFSFDN